MNSVLRAGAVGICGLVLVACGGMPDPDAPIEVDDDWWVPDNPGFSRGCPPGDGTMPDVDLDGDATPDSWSISVPMTDEAGNTIRIVCVMALGEYHFILNGQSVGKCPWPGGRNIARKYGRDSNHDNIIDDADGDGMVDEYGWFLWISSDGPLPGDDTNGDGVPDVGHANYGMYDEDMDGMIDVTVYVYHGEMVTKRHFEVDWNDPEMPAEELDDDEEEFAPTDPPNVPDDYASAVAPGGDPMAEWNLALLPPGVVAISTETVPVRDTTHEVGLRITNGWPILAEPRQNGIAVNFFATIPLGTVEVSVPASFREELGLTEAGTVDVAIDQLGVPFERFTTADGTDVFTVQFDTDAMRVEILYSE